MAGEAGADGGQSDVRDGVPGRDQLQPAAQLSGEAVSRAVTEMIMLLL